MKKNNDRKVYSFYKKLFLWNDPQDRNVEDKMGDYHNE